MSAASLRSCVISARARKRAALLAIEVAYRDLLVTEDHTYKLQNHGKLPPRARSCRSRDTELDSSTPSAASRSALLTVAISAFGARMLEPLSCPSVLLKVAGSYPALASRFRPSLCGIAPAGLGCCCSGAGGPPAHDAPIVTSDEVREAFELLAEPGMNMLVRAKILHAAATSPLLQHKPLSQHEWTEMRRVVGIDDNCNGLVPCARFIAALSVLPPFPKEPKKPGRCSCCCRWWSRAVHKSSALRENVPVNQYAEAADLEQGMCDGDGALGARTIAI